MQCTDLSNLMNHALAIQIFGGRFWPCVVLQHGASVRASRRNESGLLVQQFLRMVTEVLRQVL